MSRETASGRRAALKGAAALGIGAALPWPVTAAAAEALQRPPLDRLQQAMDALVADGYMPGAAWLVHRGGDTHTGTAGTHRLGGAGPAMTRDSIFRVASITKPVTACLAMMLVEEGKLTLVSQRMMTSPQPPESYVAFWTRVYEAV